MDEPTSTRIVRNVRAVDFFDSLEGLDSNIDNETISICIDYFKKVSKLKGVKDLRITGFKDRLDKIDYAIENIDKVGDEHHLFLEGLGVKFDENLLDNIGFIKRKYKAKLAKLEVVDSDTEEEFEPFESRLIRLEMIYKFSISIDISLVKFLYYVKHAKDVTNG